MDQISKHFVGRILIASLFVISGLLSIYGFDNFSGMIKSKNVPLPILIAVIGIAMKLLGGLSVMFDVWPRYGVNVLIVFTILATIMFHNVFIDSSQINAMLKNMAIIGGLLVV